MNQRYVIATTYIILDNEDEDLPEESKRAKTSVDLYAIERIQEGWEKGTVELIHHDGSFIVVEGRFKEWHDRHMEAKQEQYTLYRRPAFN